MNTIIILLVLISVAVLALWGYLIINLAKDKKARRASRKLSEEAGQLSRKAQASQKQSLSTKKSLDEETAKIKSKVIEQVENNIAEVMVSYLAEVAGDLDYYQQKDYLYKALEDNKQAIKKDIENAV